MNIQPFDFQGHEVRVIAEDPEKPLWVARDVATALGYKDPTSAIKAHCRGVANHHPIQDRLGRTQNARVIAEPDLYRLIVGSDLETAQEFERVVFEEVLPSIRKRGGYLTPEAAEEALTDPDFIIRLATDLKAERAKVAELKPAADSWTYLAAPGGDYGVAGAAKVLSRDPSINIGRNKLFDFMAQLKWIFRTTGKRAHWEAYQDKGINTGRLVHKLSSPFMNERTGEWEQPAPTIRITPKGLHELHKLLGGSDQIQLEVV
ncbi:phage antirepressor [Corynebacterium striatum]|uniref:phage antirepressor n=1 Tax=Corynebacterium striatum TaxID=43770 RepID=UPI00254E129E|nr:phage antirepressor [Corynebacterium striatum]MDK8844695.1 phage antirepressor [Corynebacterium striatum]